MNVSLQSCQTLWGTMGCSPPGSSVHGILQARILKLVAISFSRGSSWPRIEPRSLVSPALAGEFFTTSATWEAPAKGGSSLKLIWGKLYLSAWSLVSIKPSALVMLILFRIHRTNTFPLCPWIKLDLWYLSPLDVCVHSVMSDSLLPHGL